MSLFKKIHHSLEKVHRKVGLGKTASKLIARSLTGDSIGALRVLQRSHKLGHTWASSWSDQNQITRSYNKLMRKISAAAVRSVASKSNSASQVRTQTSMPKLTSQRLNYDYRRLSDLI